MCYKSIFNLFAKDMGHIETEHINQAQSSLPTPPCSQFVVFVDGMDGDVYPDWNKMTHGVTHAFKHGAKEVTIKKWPTANDKAHL